MTQSIYCAMAHGGLNIDLKTNDQQVYFNQCCGKLGVDLLEDGENIWNNKKLIPLRELNDNNIWHQGCWYCQSTERSGLTSFRTSMVEKFGIKRDLVGPGRIDLLFDTGCNLACRICGPHSSTYWQKHLRDNNIQFESHLSDKSRVNEAIDLLKSIDLSNLEILQFCGGETLMGNNYWRVVEYLATAIPHAKDKLLIGFQTNGTQTIDPRYYELIEKFHLVKIVVSLDGIGDRFNYLRWPGNWNQVTDNLLQLKENLPNNVMFLVEETYCLLNLFYYRELAEWVNANFNSNRLGDPIDHNKHVVAHQHLDLSNITHEYYESIKSQHIVNLLPTNWEESPEKIKAMIDYVEKFDRIRDQDWRKTFPEVSEFYSRYFR